MTAAHWLRDEFRGEPQPTCDRCGRTEKLQRAKVGTKNETLCPTCRAAFDAEPVWVDKKNYQVPRHNLGIDDV